MILPLVVLAAALAALLITPPAALMFGFSHAAFASLALSAALLLALAIGGAMAPFLRALISAAFWATALVALWFGYEHRLQLGNIAVEAMDSLSEPEATVGASGEVTIRRALGGGFLVPAKVNDRPVKFVFDTGASMVVLTAEDARRVGVDLTRLDYSAEVMTANGSALAATTRLSRIAVGPIVVRNVTALVTRPGAMAESLLGMSFLEQLESYKVEKGRLTLTAKRTAG